MKFNKKIMLVAALCIGMVSLQSFVKQHDDDKAANLKVLPKDTSEKDLHKIMRAYSMSLGVHCDHCHVAIPAEGGGRPKMDFASDAKPEKEVARQMMRMTEAINKDHLGKMSMDGHTLGPITCVTCHMGKLSPMVSVDSLPRTPREMQHN